MPIDKSEILAKANTLLHAAEASRDLQRVESLCRSAVSRRYYYLYHSAREFAVNADSLGFSPLSPDEKGRVKHADLWRWFKQKTMSEASLGMWAGNRATTLHVQRDRADYDIYRAFLAGSDDESATPLEKEDILEKTRDFFRNAEELENRIKICRQKRTL